MRPVRVKTDGLETPIHLTLTCRMVDIKDMHVCENTLAEMDNSASCSKAHQGLSFGLTKILGFETRAWTQEAMDSL